MPNWTMGKNMVTVVGFAHTFGQIRGQNVPLRIVAFLPGMLQGLKNWGGGGGVKGICNVEAKNLECGARSTPPSPPSSPLPTSLPYLTILYGTMVISLKFLILD